MPGRNHEIGYFYDCLYVPLFKQTSLSLGTTCLYAFVSCNYSKLVYQIWKKDSFRCDRTDEKAISVSFLQKSMHVFFLFMCILSFSFMNVLGFHISQTYLLTLYRSFESSNDYLIKKTPTQTLTIKKRIFLLLQLQNSQRFSTSSRPHIISLFTGNFPPLHLSSQVCNMPHPTPDSIPATDTRLNTSQSA